MSKIFISYRRADSTHVTSRIYDRLVQEFGKKNVFKDIDNISPGKDFRTELSEATARCKVMLVIVGDQWATVTDSKGNRRLNDPGDFVRQEIEFGLGNEHILVIPVLVKKAEMPDIQQLPPTLQKIAFHHAFTVQDDPYFHRDMDTLSSYIRKHLNKKRIFGPRLIGIVSLIMLAVVMGAFFILTRLVEAPDDKTAQALEDATQLPEPTAQFTESILTPTIEPTLAPTVDPLQGARSFSGTNQDWTVVSQIFEDDPLAMPASMEMVLVPAGQFMMGDSKASDSMAHSQSIPAPYWIDRTEVTRAAYQLCVNAGRCPDVAPSATSQRPTQPVAQVAWTAARDFCRWRGMRLPTEKEWEFAAKGPSGLQYPWGDSWNPELAIWNGSPINATADAGSIPQNASWVGAYDLSGNLWEWTSSIYRDRYPYTAQSENDNDTTSGRVIRGGGFVRGQDRLTTSFRSYAAPSLAGSSNPHSIGFRCVRDAGA